MMHLETEILVYDTFLKGFAKTLYKITTSITYTIAI